MTKPYTPSQQPGSGEFAVAEIDKNFGDFFRSMGYAVVRDALSPREVDELIAETVAICRGKRGVFGDHRGEKPETADRGSMSDGELLRGFLCIHHPHKGSPLMHKYLSQPAIVRALTHIIGPNVKCMQSMLFIKASGKPGQAWHQDEDYIPTRDRSLTGVWIALDDATIHNGCLWVLPGSHRPGVLWPQYPHEDKRFDCAWESYEFPYRDEDAIPVEVKRGSVVLFNGYLLHRSLPNHATGGFRRSLVNHYMSAESFLPWRVEEGVGMAKIDFRDIVIVAGEDPYPWKPITNLSTMHIRPDGRGGCGDGRMSLDAYRRKSMDS